ncbi:hypothetical protein LJR225_003195 [Phenylobacterium sp. LjRoot225]|uniref:hypothetical protein n=1 Tax=Phenylobacterium sp. LjRoot225 TaxID=3342285 RepID=UPI003ED07EA1
MVSLAPPLDARPAAAARSLGGFAAPALAGLLAFAFVLAAPQVLNDGDSWWHVAAGGWMLDHRRILHTDVFSYTFAGRPWHTHEWLAELLMAAAFRAAGWSGVVLLYGAAMGAAMAILARRIGRALPPLSLALALLLAFGCISPSLLARPHLLALPLLAAWTAGLLGARDKGRAPPLALAALMVPWANVHGGYVMGLALIGPFALEALTAAKPDARVATFRAWALFGIASLAASLITPFGFSGLLFPFQLLGMTSLAGVGEWRPMDFSRIGPLEIALVASLYVMLQRGVRVPALRLVLLLVLLHMALQHNRHQILLAMIGAMLLAEPLGQALAPDRKAAPAGPVRRGWVAACAAAALALAGLRLAVPIVRVDGPSAPIAALAHVPAALRIQPVFNDYGFGGYLIAQGVRPFIDGRTDMYGDAFTNAYFRAGRPDPAKLDALLARWKVSWTLLAAGDPTVGVMDRRPGWRRLYADRYAVVHARDGSL